MSKKITIIGARGHWGRKITQDLTQAKYTINAVDIDNQVDLTRYDNLWQNDFIIIATPPTEHAKYIDFLVKPYRYTLLAGQQNWVLRSKCKISCWLKAIALYAGIAWCFRKPLILCEKPLPQLDFFEKNKKLGKRIRVVDHYLYKVNIGKIKYYFKKDRYKIKKIYLYLCEKNQEKRNWMFDSHQYGGVTLDLAHHLISILAELVGYASLDDAKNIYNIKFIQFDYGLADKELKMTFEVAGFYIYLHVGKDIENRKQVVFQHFDGYQEAFDLQDTVSYTKIIQNPEKALSIPAAKSINRFLRSILCEQKAQANLSKLKKMDMQEVLSALECLQSEFKHRHSFYWSSYYKLLLYHLFIIILPVFAYFYASKIDFDKGILSYFVLIISFLLASYFIPKTLKRAKKYLDDEDHRLKLSIDRMREIYYARFGVNIYPDKQQALSFINVNMQSFLQKEQRKPKGLGADYMMAVFWYICMIASWSVFLAFLVLFCNPKEILQSFLESLSYIF